MTEGIEAGPHDWDETTRKCKRCGATTTDWQNHKAEYCSTQVASPDYRPGAAADDYSTINRRLGEIEKEDAKSRQEWADAWLDAFEAAVIGEERCPTCGLPHPATNPYCFCGKAVHEVSGAER